MSVIQVGLVDTTGKIDPDLVHATAAALNIQVIRDLPQYWTIQATVIYLPNASKIPAGVWPVKLVASLPPGEGGFHMDQNHQPYSKVIASPSSDEWTIDASHETIEMLVDPFGSKFQTSQAITIDQDGSIRDSDGQFNYLVEASDPCEADQYAYSIQGVALSDFLTPHFYDPVTNAGTRYSFTGAIKSPRQILPGGYISYLNLETNHMEQILWVNPSERPVVKDLGPAPSGTALRVWIDSKVAEYKRKTNYKRKLNSALLDLCKKTRTKMSKVSVMRAKMLK